MQPGTQLLVTYLQDCVCVPAIILSMNLLISYDLDNAACIRLRNGRVCTEVIGASICVRLLLPWDTVSAHGEFLSCKTGLN